MSVMLASVLKDEIKLETLPATTPAPLRRLLQRCLERDVRMRLRDIGEARVELSRSHEEGGETASVVASTTSAPSVAGRLVPWVVATFAAAAALVVLVLWAPWRTAPAPMPRRLLASIGADASLTTDVGASAVLSPDGSLLAFVAQQGNVRRLFVRKLGQLNATVLAGADGAMSPFFSPDGQWLAFFGDGKLKKVSVTGGSVVTLAEAPADRGGTWADDGTIVFTPGSDANVTLMRVGAAGGTAAPLTTLSEGATTQRWPQALPGAKGVLFSEHTAQINWDEGTIVVAPLSGGPPKVVAFEQHSAWLVCRLSYSFNDTPESLSTSISTRTLGRCAAAILDDEPHGPKQALKSSVLRDLTVEVWVVAVERDVEGRPPNAVAGIFEGAGIRNSVASHSIDVPIGVPLSTSANCTASSERRGPRAEARPIDAISSVRSAAIVRVSPYGSGGEVLHAADRTVTRERQCTACS